MTGKQVGILLFDNVEVLDFCGPFEVFSVTRLNEDKRREEANVAEVMNVVGDVRGRSCLIVDDMCDTGGSLTKVAHALKDAGAERIHACFTHPVVSGKAVELLRESEIEKVIVTNTIQLRDHACELDKVKVLSIAPLLAKAIKSIHEETSVSSLFV